MGFVSWMRAALLAAGVVLAGPAFGDEGGVDLPRYPSISPDGQSIAFSWRGDLWKVSSKGGLAARLTAHPRDDLRSAWSPDGAQIAFTSDRSGWLNIHLMNADGTNVRQITDTDRSLQLSGFSADGRHVLFAGRIEGDVYRADRPYQVALDGGPIERVHDAFGTWPQVGNDGEVVFVRGESPWYRRHYKGSDNRNVWTYDPKTKTFHQLTTWEGNDARPRFLGDHRVLFLSDREFGTVNLYEVDDREGEKSVRRLTAFNGPDIQEFDVSRDGKTAVLQVWDTLYTLDLRRYNVNAYPLSITAPQDEADNFQLKDVDHEVTEARLSPDGQVMAYVAYGDVYVRNVDEGQPTRRVTDNVGRDRDIAWSPDGLTLYFSSDRDGTDSIYKATVALTRSEIEEKLEPAKEKEAAETEKPAPAENAPEKADGQAKENAKANGEEENGKKGKDEEKEKEKEKNPADRWHDAVKFTIQPVVQSALNDRHPRPSPDGKTLGFQRTRGDIMLLDLESGAIQTFHPSWNIWIDWSWSPDSKLMAIADMNENYNSEIWIAPIDRSFEPVNISKHPDNDTQPRWSADGKILSFLSDREGDTDVWMVYLDKDVEALGDVELRKYYEDAAKAAKKRKPLKPEKAEADKDNAEKADEHGEEAKPEEAKEEEGEEKAPAADLELDDAYLRLKRVTSFPGDEGNLELTPGGDRYVFTASGGAGGEGGLFSIKWDGKDKQRLTDSVDVQHLSLDGSKVVFVGKGRGATVPVAGGKVEYSDIDQRIRVDLEAQATQMFQELARVLGITFYSPNMKGLDWPALSKQYLELAKRTRTPNEFAYVAMRLLGELNASHLGVYPHTEPNPNSEPNGRLGIDVARVQHNAQPAYRVDRVIERGPTAAGTMALKDGDVITQVEFEALDPHGTFDSALKGRTGKETILTVIRDVDPDGADGPAPAAPTELNLIVTPISARDDIALRYDDWQRHNARLVDQWSGGRIGYLHIRAMGQADLVEFERDLYAAAYGKDGLLVDVRNNGGGWTADRVLASLMVKPHAYTAARGDTSGSTDGYPQDRLFIQRYTKPVDMLCNEKSFSNAEIVSHAFKTLGRGHLVGQTTYGGVISTGGWRLIDGTFVRQPFRGWFIIDGTDMENHGAVPDVLVPPDPEDEAADQPYGYDRQLKAAVDDLLKRIE